MRFDSKPPAIGGEEGVDLQGRPSHALRADRDDGQPEVRPRVGPAGQQVLQNRRSRGARQRPGVDDEDCDSSGRGRGPHGDHVAPGCTRTDDAFGLVRSGPTGRPAQLAAGQIGHRDIHRGRHVHRRSAADGHEGVASSAHGRSVRHRQRGDVVWRALTLDGRLSDRRQPTDGWRDQAGDGSVPGRPLQGEETPGGRGPGQRCRWSRRRRALAGQAEVMIVSLGRTCRLHVL